MNGKELERYEELVKERDDSKRESKELFINYEKAKDKIKDLQKTVDVLTRTCKAHNDFFDDADLRKDFQDYFDNIWIKREENK